MNRKITALLLFCITLQGLSADWNPVYMPSENLQKLEILNSPQLSALENQVFASVKNSWCSEEKAKLIVELIVLTEPKVSVEIGSFTGSSTIPLLSGLQYLSQGKAYVIDAWSNEEAVKGLPSDDPNTIWWRGLDMRAIKNHFTYMVKSHSFTPYCQTLSMSSEEAASYVPPIDFLHLDGNFSEEGSLLDSTLYIPKVVSGGYVLLSNALVMIGGKPTKMKALWPIFAQCEVICEIDNGNTLLFRKK